jgi:hypothetical protein
MAEELTIQNQPDDVVVTDSEADTETPVTPQAGEEGITEDDALVIDVEDDQLKQSKFDTSSPEYKAFRKANEAKKRKNQIINEMMMERAQQAKQLTEMQQKLAQIERGKPPEIDDFIDEKEFQKATREYYEKAGPQDPQMPVGDVHQPPPSQGYGLDEKVEYEHYVQEQEVRKSFKDYDDAVNSLKEDIHSEIQRNAPQQVPFDDVVNAFITTGNLAGVNMAKAMFALQKVPSLKAELLNPRVLGSDILIADVLRKAEKSVTKGRKVSTTPPPSIRQGGSISNQSKAVQKAREKWQETGSAADFAKLQAIKREARNG